MTRLSSLRSRARCDVAQAAVRTLTVAALLLGACTENPAAPIHDPDNGHASGATGQLIVESRGLPAGLKSRVTVQGPGGYRQQASSGDTLRGLAPGAYTVNADAAVVAGTSVAPDESTQTVMVDGGLRPQSIIISFDALLRRALVIVDVAGLPSGVSANLRLTSPTGAVKTATRTDSVDYAALGDWTLEASPVTVGASTYTPNPTSQSRTVRDRDAVKLSVRYEVGTGSLALAVVGLPSGANGNVTITGPNGFSRTLTGTTTLTGLTIGSYTIAATSVTANGVTYAPTPASTTVQVQASVVAAGATVSYAATAAPTGTLALTVNGLPAGQNAQVSVTGPNGYARTITTTTSITGLTPGAYTITAAHVRTSSGAYNGLPSSQVVNVLSAQSVSGSITYAALPAVVELPITGLPNGTAAAVTLTAPSGTNTTHTASTVIGNAATGRWRMAAANVTTGGFTYAPSPASYDQTVLAGDTLTFPVAYSLSSGALAITVAGLPTGSTGTITVTGPNSFSRTLTATTTLTNLAPGTYTVSATSVTAGGLTYQPSPATRTVTVTASLVAEPASVVYTSQTGSLNVSVSGLPAGANPDLVLTGPNSFSQNIAAAGTLSALPPGAYTLTVRAVRTSAGTYTSSTLTRAVTITANTTATQTVAYAAAPSVVSVSVSGVPAGTNANISLIAPSGTTSQVTASTTNTNAATGRWRLTASTVQSGGHSYTATPTSYDRTILAGDTLDMPVAYALSTGAIAVSVSGLPQGTNGTVVVTGPNSFSQTATATTTLTNLTPGTYTISASSVTVNGTTYAPSPATRTVTVTASLVAQAASVAYTSQAGALTLTVAGLPSGASGDMTLTGPNGYSRALTATTSLTGLAAGSYALSVRNVRTSAGTYAGTPASAAVTITTGGTASQTVTYAALPAVVKVPVTGVPSGSQAAITLTSPSGSTSSVTAATTNTGAATGRWRLAAASITSGGHAYAPSPASYDQTVLAGDTLDFPVAYALATGAIATSVSGLPNGVNASLTITGPNSFSQTVTATQTITGLVPGTYTVTAASVTSGGVSYAPTPATRTVTVTASLVAQAAAVSYASQAGSFALTVSGLPSGASGDMTLTGPSSYSKALTATTTLTGLAAGSYTLTVRNVRTSAGTYTASPLSQAVTITAGGSASQTVTYSALAAVVAVPVSGLPSGAQAAITLTAPSGGTTSVTATTTNTSATTGRWRLSAASITSGGHGYAPSPASYEQTVLAGDTLNFPVSYALATGAIAVTASGLPSGANAAITVTGPGSYSKAVTATQTLTGLVPGSYTVTAASVTAGGTTYAPSPATRTVTVTASLTAQAAAVTYAAQGGGSGNGTNGAGGGSSSTPNLSIENVYVTQAAQNWEGTAPIVIGRDALARVFVKAAATNSARPDVRLRIYANGSLVSTVTVPATAASVPTAISEGTMSSSWNVVIPAANVRSGMQVLADLDPNNTLGESDRTDNVWPRGGTLKAVTTVNPAAMEVKFVPVTVAGLTGNVSESNKASWLEMLKLVHPVRDVTASVRAPFVSNASSLQSSDGNGAWLTVLNEMNALRAVDKDATSHYYGVVKTSYSSGVAGYGLQPGRAAVGWDQDATYQRIFAHEIGHNFGLAHAPCGVSGTAAYPYAGGVTGTWGWNAQTNTLVSPTATDVMGYCSTQWVSDWTWSRVAQWRGTASMVASAASSDGLLLWGRSTGGVVTLEPAFPVFARATPQPAAVTHEVDLYDEHGSLLANHGFTMESIDHADDAQQFAIVVPVSTAVQEKVARIVVRSMRSPRVLASQQSARSTQAAVRDTGDQQSSQVETRLESVGGARRRVNWNEKTFRMGMVRDRNTGEILSFLRRPGDEFRDPGHSVEIVFSDGTRSVREQH